jgi:hypothetical protein
VHAECTVQSRQDFLQWGIPCLDSDGLRGAANLYFGEHRRRSNCQSGAQQDCNPDPVMRRAEGAYSDGGSCRQFCNLPVGAPFVGSSSRHEARRKTSVLLLTVVPVIYVLTNWIFEDAVPLLNLALLLASLHHGQREATISSQPDNSTLVPFPEPVT